MGSCGKGVRGLVIRPADEEPWADQAALGVNGLQSAEASSLGDGRAETWGMLTRWDEPSARVERERLAPCEGRPTDAPANESGATVDERRLGAEAVGGL